MGALKMDAAKGDAVKTGAVRMRVVRAGGAVTGERIMKVFVLCVMPLWGLAAYVRTLLNNTPEPALHGKGLAVVVLNVVMFALGAAGLLVGRGKGSRWRGHGIVLLLASVATVVPLYAVARHTVTFIAMVPLWVLLRRIPVLWGIGVGVLTTLAVGAVGATHPGGEIDFGLMAAFAGMTLGGLASRQASIAQEATRRAEAANAVLAERSHIAREIHDILAHSLSAQLVHLEGARLLLSRDGDRVQALDRVERARNLARSGLEETRRALATLRGEIPEPKEVIAGLAEEFYAGTGRPCDVRVTGTPRELSPQAGLAVVRTAQEALTNVRKHAPGARAHVALRYLSAAVELEVTDTGATEPGLDLGLDSGGYGLAGMRERAELIDGTLETGPDGKGFRVSLRVPA
ncbi:sensor histidine kinase [Actinomadura terrae]|uniref:sensor histidine kinase n=1 Tax=Actinomadura terrae TaxID=604353 RepID=UPI001FA6FC19|nr:sensor histidine kinase [Actinomadura terrae]